MLLLRGEVLFCCCCIFVGCCRVCNFAVAALLLVLFVFAVGPRGECICDALCCGGAFFFFCCWCKGCFFLLCCGGGGVFMEPNTATAELAVCSACALMVAKGYS